MRICSSMRNTEFHDYVVYDLFGGMPDISSQAMFSGFGIYQSGKIFALIIEGELYLKGGEKAKDFFKENGGETFSYKKKDGKSYVMNYWLVPGEVLDNSERLSEWTDWSISEK